MVPIAGDVGVVKGGGGAEGVEDIAVVESAGGGVGGDVLCFAVGAEGGCGRALGEGVQLGAMVVIAAEEGDEDVDGGSEDTNTFNEVECVLHLEPEGGKGGGESQGEILVSCSVEEGEVKDEVVEQAFEALEWGTGFWEVVEVSE